MIEVTEVTRTEYDNICGYLYEIFTGEVRTGWGSGHVLCEYAAFHNSKQAKMYRSLTDIEGNPALIIKITQR